MRRPDDLDWRLRMLAQRIESWGDEIDCADTDADDLRTAAEVVAVVQWDWDHADLADRLQREANMTADPELSVDLQTAAALVRHVVIALDKLRPAE